MNQRMIDEAFRLASSRQMCCQDDLKLLIKLVQDHDEAPRVVQLGAGSGTMALAILGAREDGRLWTVDNDEENIGWERKALVNAGFDPEAQTVIQGYLYHRYYPTLSDSAVSGRSWVDPVDLVVIDAEHSYRGVKRDLHAWGDKGTLFFCHDYDGTTAPRRYPGVKRACDEYFGKTPIMKAGWSAVFEMGRKAER